MTYQLHRISVLVVEDSQPMLELTKSLLLAFGIGHVVGASDGESGFRLLCRHNPDIVLSDWMMKPMDGITFTRLVRNSPESPNPYVPIILVTGFSERRRVLQARDAGATEFLVKPFNARDLYKRIAQIIERPRQFVRSEDFFGPDRRRSLNQEFVGPFRRRADPGHSETLQHLNQQQEDAHKTLRRIREERGLDAGDRFDLDNPDKADMT